MRTRFSCGHRGHGSYCHRCKPNTPMTKEEAQKRFKSGQFGEREFKKWTARGWLE